MNESPLFVTKEDLRACIAQILRDSHATGVPEDGIAEMLSQWVVGHLERGTKVVRDLPLLPSPVVPSAPPRATPKPLTTAQAKELKLLAVGPQNTFGTHRARRQNSLVLAHHARFLGPDGREMSIFNDFGMKNLTEMCEITEAGRRALAEYLKTNGRKRR